MKKIIVLSLLVVISGIQVFAQDGPYASQIAINAGLGILTPVHTTFENGQLSDKLVGYKNTMVYWQTISGSYYFRKRLGVRIDLQLGFPNNPVAQRGAFESLILQEFGRDQYYVVENPAFEPLHSSNAYIWGTFMAGVVYRIEGLRWYCYPRISAGYSTIGVRDRDAYLKRKNSNEIIHVSYVRNVDLSVTSSFNLLAGFSTGYKLTNRLYVNADFSLMQSESDIQFTRSVVNVSNAQTLEESTIDYPNSILNFNANIGAVLVLRKRREFRDLK